MYRTVKKTTKKTEYKCIGCQYCKLLDETKQEYGQMVMCTADNRCIMTSFNAKHYTCKESKGFSEMTDYQKGKIIEEAKLKQEKKAYKEYLAKYYTKEEAKKMYKAKYDK